MDIIDLAGKIPLSPKRPIKKIIGKKDKCYFNVILIN